jgi:small subunit ribosomal protein S20
MPNIKSAKKRVKVISVKTLKNKMAKSNLKTTIKKFKAAVESGDKEAAKTAYTAAVKAVDQAVGKGLLHKNNAAHKKSQYTLMLNKMA